MVVTRSRQYVEIAPKAEAPPKAPSQKPAPVPAKAVTVREESTKEDDDDEEASSTVAMVNAVVGPTSKVRQSSPSSAVPPVVLYRMKMRLKKKEEECEGLRERVECLRKHLVAARAYIDEMRAMNERLSGLVLCPETRGG